MGDGGLFGGRGASVWNDENVLEIGGDDVHTTL